MPVIPDFLARYPEVWLDINFTARSVDLFDEGIGLAIRSGDLRDSRLVFRPLQSFRLLWCASPA
jgi:DNA-binding transcriptional LysR family regulator